MSPLLYLLGFVGAVIGVLLGNLAGILLVEGLKRATRALAHAKRHATRA